MPRYHTSVGPAKGPWFYRDSKMLGVIGVRETPPESLQIGMAFPVGPDDTGVALWELLIHGAKVPGLWIVVDREFRPASAVSRSSPSSRPPDTDG